MRIAPLRRFYKSFIPTYPLNSGYFLAKEVLMLLCQRNSPAKWGTCNGEIKPLTSSGVATFNRQVQRWRLGPVQPIAYDAAGNVYYGFYR